MVRGRLRVMGQAVESVHVGGHSPETGASRFRSLPPPPLWFWNLQVNL